MFDPILLLIVFLFLFFDPKFTLRVLAIEALVYVGAFLLLVLGIAVLWILQMWCGVDVDPVALPLSEFLDPLFNGSWDRAWAFDVAVTIFLGIGWVYASRSKPSSIKT